MGYHINCFIALYAVIRFHLFTNTELQPCCSSRMTARGTLLAESQSEGFYGSSNLERNQIQTSYSPGVDHPSSSTVTTPIAFLLKLRAKFYGVWLWTVQKWPSVLYNLYVFFATHNLPRMTMSKWKSICAA